MVVTISSASFLDPVLIETLWNVNLMEEEISDQLYEGINRNIVECKSLQSCRSFQSDHSINRNIVECKSG